MGAKSSTDWELDFGDDNVVPIHSRRAEGGASGLRAVGSSDTQRGLPRVVPMEHSPAPAPVPERPLQRQPPAAQHVRRVYPVADPQCESTLEFDSSSLARHRAAAPTTPRRTSPPEEPARSRRAAHADLDLNLARHDDPYHKSALIVLSDLHTKSAWQTWAAIGAGVVTVTAVLIGILV